MTPHPYPNAHLWDSLVSSALLGTGRRPPALPASPTATGRLLAGLGAADVEGALLAASVVAALHRRAARLPAVDTTPLPEPCPAEDRPPCSGRAGQHLGLMLKGQYPDLLPEWLAGVAQRGRCVPAEHLPDLLNLGTAKVELHNRILDVSGSRGRWLAAQNSAWEFAAGDVSDEGLWQTGTRPVRLALLRHLRARDPGRALAMLAATWPQEQAADRVAFIEALRNGLSMADEPFLEDCLDDRLKTVRTAAANLLARLPQSRLCVRMHGRVSQLVKWRKGSKPGFAVSLPEACDKDMQRDGIEPKVPQNMHNQGEKSWWLMQMMAVMPLDAWRGLCGAAPDVIVLAAGRHSEWSAMLLQALVTAAARTGDLEWVEALLEQKKVSSGITLFQALPVDKKESHLLKLLSANPSVKYGAPAMPYLFACQHPWSGRLSKAVMAAVYKDLSDGKVKYSYQLASLFELIARHLAPPAVPEVIKRMADLLKRMPDLAKPASTMAKEVDKFLSTLQFRQEMLKAIQD